MMKGVKFLKILLWILLFSSCQEVFDYQVDQAPKILVVQAWLTNEYKNQQILLTYTKSNPNAPVEYATGARVLVNDGQTTYFFEPSEQEPGLYVSTRKFAAVINRTYKLIIRLEDSIYTATTGVKPVNEPDTLLLHYDSLSQMYSIKYVAPIFSPYESALYILYLDWSHLPGYDQLPYDSTHAKLYYYTLQTMDVNEIFQPYQEQIFFPPGTKIVEYKYSLTPFFATYLRALLSETHWSGSLFDVQHWNLPTNINGGALGFFTASSVIKKEYVAGE